MTDNLKRPTLSRVKILLDHSNPFLLAHGGAQTQIENTKAALESHGVQVDFLRWWDPAQPADLIHYFNAAPVGYLELARRIGIPVVMTTLFSTTCNRSDWRLWCQGWLTRFLLSLPGAEGIKRQLIWRTFHLCDHNFVGLAAEQQVLEKVYRVPRRKITQVPLGLSERYLRAGTPLRKGPHLISTGTITPCKGTVELARLARAAKVPILFVGKPYHADDPYWAQFTDLIDNESVQYHPHVSQEDEMVALLQGARGFVLKSHYENWCLSAHEAAACGLPLLLPDLKWSRERFGNQTAYFSGNFQRDISVLREFHAQAARKKAPEIKLWSWKEAVTPLISVYQSLVQGRS